MKDFRNKDYQEDKARSAAQPETDEQSKTEKLVERAADGDFEAFGKLYSLHITQIYRYIFYQVKDKTTAEDITEEVFLKAWRAIDSCRGKGKTFSSWLYRIARNQVIDEFRSRRKYPSIEIETVAGISNTEREPEGELERQELLAVIACLPQSQRQVIILKFIEGLDNPEIARIIGKSQGAVRVLQMRALAKLKKVMGSEK